MAKNKWVIAVVVLAVLAVGVYNVHYFLNREANAQAQPIAVVQPANQSTPSPSEPVTVAPSGTEPTSMATGANPPIYWDQLQAQSYQAVAAAAANAAPTPPWPKRDPFTKNEPLPLAARSNEIASVPADPPEPHYTVSAILIQGNRRLAIIDGAPRQVGAHLGKGKITAIEPHYVLLDAAKGTRRLDLAPAQSPMTSAEGLDKKKL
jgi:hypothetical protein